MRDVRIYQAGDYQIGQSITLSESAGQHVGIVLRMKVGDKLTLFCGDNREFTALIEQIHKKQVCVTVLSEKNSNKESPRALHLAQGISKGERMEFVVQKAVELGVTSITPLLTERSVVKLDKTRLEKKITQWQAIAIAACEQCGRNKIPEIHFPKTLSEYLIETKEATLKLVLHPGNAKTWRDYSFHSAAISLMIGPEGGFSPEEIAEIFTHHFHPLTLGPRILRTETAAIAAISVLQAVCGDL